MRKLITVIIIASQCLAACGQVKTTRNMSTIEKFVSNYSQFNMDIQSAGIATIPTASFENNTLKIEYAYFSEGENRKGKMTLIFNPETNRFEGSWQTNADNGNVYKGSLYFVFDENGEANGEYQFAKSNYKITIFRIIK